MANAVTELSDRPSKIKETLEARIGGAHTIRPAVKTGFFQQFFEVAALHGGVAYNYFVRIGLQSLFNCCDYHGGVGDKRKQIAIALVSVENEVGLYYDLGASRDHLPECPSIVRGPSQCLRHTVDGTPNICVLQASVSRNKGGNGNSWVFRWIS